MYWYARYLCSGTGGVHWPKEIHLPSFVYWYSRHLCSGLGGSIGQSRFICQVLCISMQGISAVVLEGPSAKVGSSAKICILVFKASLFWYGGGGPLAKAGSSAKFCVLVFKTSQLWYQGVGAIGQSRFICQVLCSDMQGISALVLGDSIGQSRFICQVLCTGIHTISALVLRGPLAKVGSSAKFCVVACKSSLLWYWGGAIGRRRFISQVISALVPGGGPLAKVGSSAKFCVVACKSSLLWYQGGAIGIRRFICQVISALVPGGHQQKKVRLPNLNSFQVLLLLHRRSFRITYERPNKLSLWFSLMKA